MIKGTQAVKGELSFLGEQFSDALRSDQVSSRSEFCNPYRQAAAPTCTRSHALGPYVLTEKKFYKPTCLCFS